MSYSTSSPPKLVVCAIGNNSPAIWTYESTDGASDVDADGYITNGKKLGMKLGDIVLVTDTNASPRITTTHMVASVSTTDSSVDLSDGVTIASTDSD
jgi:hypothetical protein